MKLSINAFNIFSDAFLAKVFYLEVYLNLNIIKLTMHVTYIVLRGYFLYLPIKIELL